MTVHPDDALTHVATVTGFSRARLISKNTRPDLQRTRRVLWDLLHRYTMMSDEEIGMLFLRDRSTITKVRTRVSPEERLVADVYAESIRRGYAKAS